MYLKHVVLGAAIAVAAGAPAANTTAKAANGMYIPQFSYRPGGR